MDDDERKGNSNGIYRNSCRTDLYGRVVASVLALVGFVFAVRTVKFSK